MDNTIKILDTVNNGTLEVRNTLNTVGGVFESSSGRIFPSRLQDAAQGKVLRILSDVSEALHPEELTGANEQAREFQVRMGNFVQEVERVREGFGYGYNREDYIKRLSVSSEVVTEIFERILTENEGLRKAYDEVIEGFSGDGEKLKERIMKDYLEDLVYEGMKEGEYSNGQDIGRLDLQVKSAEEVKEMIVGFAKSGGRGLDLGGYCLDEIFIGKPKLFKEMVVEFAKNGGRGLKLGSNHLDEIFSEEPKLFKEMVVGFAKSGGRGLDLGDNYLSAIFAEEPELFKEMVVKYTKSGGRGLGLNGNRLGKIFEGKPKLFKEMVVEFAKNGGRGLDLWSNPLEGIFSGKPELFKDMIVEFARNGGKWLDLGWNFLNKILESTIEIEGSITKKVTVREIIEETCTTYGVIIEL